MHILNFFDKLFNHSAIATALSGFGPKLLSKIKNIFIKLKHNTKNKSHITTSTNITTDIHDIKEVVNSSCSDTKKKQTFLHYFYKYKHKFDANEVDMLNSKFEQSKTGNECDFLLSCLLGLIEALYDTD